MYNNIYSQPSKIGVNRSRKDEAFNQVDLEAFNLHQDKTKILPMTKLFQESGNDLPLFEEK